MLFYLIQNHLHVMYVVDRTHKCYLKYDNRTHIDEKLTCVIFVENAFLSSSKLTVHYRTYTGEKSFACDVVRRSFT